MGACDSNLSNHDEIVAPQEVTLFVGALCCREREVRPRFATPNSLEHAVATQWKMAYESEKRQRDDLEQHLRQARNSLVNEMESIKEQHQTEMLRQELLHHQQEQLRLVEQLRMRQGALAAPLTSGLDANGAGSSMATSLFPSQPQPTGTSGPGPTPASLLPPAAPLQGDRSAPPPSEVSHYGSPIYLT